MTWPNCCAGTYGSVISAGYSCRSGSPARRPTPSGPAPTLPRIGLWADGPGRSFWPSVWASGSYAFAGIISKRAASAAHSSLDPEQATHPAEGDPTGRVGVPPRAFVVAGPATISLARLRAHARG